MVERQLPKLYVEGSIPFSRSIASTAHSASRCATRKEFMAEHAERPETVSLPLIAAGAGALVALLGTGLYLWAVHGAAIFTDLVSAAIAWCM